MSGRILVALDSRFGRRDALVLGAQLVGAHDALVVADLLPTVRTPLAAGSEAAARRRASLRGAGDEVYATLGPDPRVRYLPVSGLPLAEAVAALAHNDRIDTIVIGRSPAGDVEEIVRLVARAPCPVAVAPYGHRFVRTFSPARIGVIAGDARAERWLASGPRLAWAAESVAVTAPAADVDLLVVGRARGELLREAACPVLIVGERAAAAIGPRLGRR